MKPQSYTEFDIGYDRREKRMKNIVIINQDAGYLMIDLANAYHEAGYLVTLITGRLVQRDKPLAYNVQLKKIIRYNRSGTFKRILTWGWGTLQILVLVWLKYRKTHLIIVSNPPFAPLLPLFLKNPFSLLIYDVYPDTLTESGVFSRNSYLVKSWENANKRVFFQADRIITLTAGMKSLVDKYSGGKKVEVIPVWTDNQFLKPVRKEENRFILGNRLSGKFVVMYSGNIGFTHEVHIMLDLAEMTDDQEILFLIVGDGNNKELIQKRIFEKQLSNCILLPLQNPEDLPYSLSAADIAVITLNKVASKLSVPSKTYNFLSVGATLLCISGSDSELKNLVDHYKVGACFNSDQFEEMKKFILEVKKHPEKKYFFSENAIKASRDFGLENIQKFLC